MSDLSVGFVGLGYMGYGMARNILTRGFALTVFAHRKREAVDDLVRRGAIEVEEISDLAKSCDVIILCVTGQQQVGELLRREKGIGASARPDTLILDCTTSKPDTIRDLASDFPKLKFIDCPLGRSPKEAWQGKLSVMVGGEADDLARVRPIIAAFADTIQHVGTLGAGHSLKLINNMVSLGYAALYSEALIMTKSSGIPLEEFDKLISTSRMDCAFFQSFMGWVRNGDATSHKFSLSVAEHALLNVKQDAGTRELSLPVLDAVHHLYAAAVAQGTGDANLPELPRLAAAGCDIMLEPYDT